VDLVTKKVINYSNAPGSMTNRRHLPRRPGHARGVRCQNRKGAGYVDLWKLKLDAAVSTNGSRISATTPLQSLESGRERRRQIHRFPNGQISEAAGVGHGIFIYDLEKAKRTQP